MAFLKICDACSKGDCEHCEVGSPPAPGFYGGWVCKCLCSKITIPQPPKPPLNEVQRMSASPLYAGLYMRMVPVARECGYALTLHGSMARDLDVVAIPWVETAVGEATLVAKLMAEFGFREFHEKKSDQPVKPHGRSAYCLGWDAGLYVDLSVMPLATNALADMTARRYAWKAWYDVVENSSYLPSSPPGLEEVEAELKRLGEMK